MTDIVERLRKDSPSVLMSCGKDFSDTLLDAANEIGRLREENKKLQRDYYDCMERLEYIYSRGKDV